MIRIGIIGGGFMGQTHARAARAAGANVAGVASHSPASAERARSLLGTEKAYPTVEAMLEDPRIDLVHICSPNAAHADHALAVLGSGKHVICEKPLATTAADAAKLATAAASTGLVAAVPFVYRFHPMVREARARVFDAGPIFSISGSYLQDWLLLPTDDDWRTDPQTGGPSRAFADIGSHLVDLLEFVANDRIDAVQAVTRTVHHERGGHPVTNDDTAALLLTMASGAIGTLLVSQVAAGHKNALALEVHTATQSVSFHQEQPDQLWLGGRDHTEVVSRDPANLTADARRLSIVPAGHPMGYLDAFTAFARDTYQTVAGHPVPGLPTFADGARAATLTEVVLAAARQPHWTAAAAV